MEGLGFAPLLAIMARSTTSFIEASSSTFLSESAQYARLLKIALGWFDRFFVSRRILKIR